MTKPKGRASPGQGTLRDKGDGKYQLLCRKDGVQFSRTIVAARPEETVAYQGRKVAREAVQALRAFSLEVERGEAVKREALLTEAQSRDLRDAVPTFGQAVAAYARDHLPAPDNVDGRSSRRIAEWAFDLVGAWRPETGGLSIGEMRVADLTRQTLHRCLRDLSHSDGKSGGALSSSSVRAVRAALDQMFDQLAEDRVIQENPVPQMKRLAKVIAPSAPKKRDALRPGQLHALLAACNGQPDLLLWVQVMAATAMRPGEALAPRWQDIDYTGEQIHVRHSVKAGGVYGAGVLGRTKTRREGIVALGPDLARLLQAERRRQEGILGQRVMDGLPGNVVALSPAPSPILDSDCVFPADLTGDRSAPKSLGGMQARLAKAVELAGLPKGTSAHWLRHTGGSVVQSSGAPLGRRRCSPPTCRSIGDGRVYSHALPAGVRKAALALDQMMAAASPPA